MHRVAARSSSPQGFWNRPDADLLRTYVWVALAGAAWFGLVYGGTDYVTAQRSFRVRVHFEAELRIPFVAWTAWIYMSIYALFLMAPFTLRSPREVKRLGATLATVTAVAGVFFLLAPGELAFPPRPHPPDPGPTTAAVALADWLNLRYNLLPSLHVALSVACVAAYAPRASRPGRVLLWTWATAVAVSTVLTHFHHVLDAVTGFLLGAAAGHGQTRIFTDKLRPRTNTD